MTDLEIITPLTAEEEAAYKASKADILTAHKHVLKWAEGIRRIRDGKLYRVEFGTYAVFCEKVLGKSVRAVQLAFQLEEVRKEIAQQCCAQNDEQTQAIAEGASAKVIEKIVKAPSAKRVEILKSAAAETGGKPTGNTIVKHTARVTHKAAPSAPLRARGGLAAAAQDTEAQPIQYDAYTSASPGETSTTTAAEPCARAFGGDMNEITDADSAEERIREVFQRDRAWFMGVASLEVVLKVMERFIEGMHE